MDDVIKMLNRIRNALEIFSHYVQRQGSRRHSEWAILDTECDNRLNCHPTLFPCPPADNQLLRYLFIFMSTSKVYSLTCNKREQFLDRYKLMLGILTIWYRICL
jgi:hypothetical protein